MNLPKRPDNQATERFGVNFVRTVVEAENCLFHEIAAGNDYGNDAFVELVQEGRVTGVCVAFQIKSGRSYCSPKSCRIPYTERQANYWKQHSLPVYGIVYDPDEECAYWTILSRAVGPKTGTSGVVRLSKSALGKFNRQNFREVLLPFLLNEPPALDLARAVAFAYSDDADEHRVGVQSLFFGHRNDPESWRHLEALLLERSLSSMHSWVCVAFAHIIGHGDIWWCPRNTIVEAVRAEVSDRIKLWGERHVLRLLEFVDENGTERGSLGQNVDAILRGVGSAPHILKHIAFSGDMNPDMRTKALYLYLNGPSPDEDISATLEQANADPALADIASRFSEFFRYIDREDPRS